MMMVQMETTAKEMIKKELLINQEVVIEGGNIIKAEVQIPGELQQWLSKKKIQMMINKMTAIQTKIAVIKIEAETKKESLDRNKKQSAMKMRKAKMIMRKIIMIQKVTKKRMPVQEKKQEKKETCIKKM